MDQHPSANFAPNVRRFSGPESAAKFDMPQSAAYDPATY
jgi:hypothetical protein